ncbi:hypothetical protein ACX8XP_07790 [Calditrichota bacterium LG25]
MKREQAISTDQRRQTICPEHAGVVNRRTENEPRFPFLAKIFFFWLLPFILIVNAQSLQPVNALQVDSLLWNLPKTFTFVFPPDHHPRLNTLRLQRNGQLLHETLDFKLFGRDSIRFYRHFSPNDTLRVAYQRLPYFFPRKMQLFKADTVSGLPVDSLKKWQNVQTFQAFKLENPLARIPTTLQTSGSIMRGVQVGSNRDFTLNSGLNLQLSGHLTDDIEIIAALTDEATPIQPEGNTQTLEEIDKVFVQFKSPFLEGTVGDFNYQYNGSQFGKVQRKLQGLDLQTRIKNQRLGATIATTRGFFHHLSFLGQEGNQGPYLLTGKNGEREIIVLAGTERVFVNGQRMIRGEDNDYVIEYGNGQLRFTNNRLITSESRIEVDFEYFPAVQNYNRNVYSAFTQAAYFKNKMQLNLHFYREKDNTSQLLEEGAALQESQKEILKQAGDDPFKAAEAGYTFKGDSAGSYVLIDTAYQGESYQVFKYVGKNKGNYSVSFTYLGSGRGDYVRDRLGVYRWIGKGRGDYAPIKLIPLPSRHDVLDVQLNLKPSADWKLRLDYALSSLDQNTFSPLDDGDNHGQAVSLSGEFTRQKLRILRRNVGTLQWRLKTRYIEKNFRAADRFRKPDFQRYWNLYSGDPASQQELSFEMNALYQPHRSVKIANNLGRFEQKDFRTLRQLWTVDYQSPKWFKAGASFEEIASQNDALKQSENWQRYALLFEKAVWKVAPFVKYRGEHRKQDAREQRKGFRFDDLGTGLSLVKAGNLSGSLTFNQRQDYVYDPLSNNRLLKQAVSQTIQLKLGLQNIRSTSINLTILQRKKDYTPAFEAIKLDTVKSFYIDPAVQDTSWRDRTSSLARINFTHRSFKGAIDLTGQYRLSTEETALKEKVYVDVGEGRGNLRYDPFLNEYVPDPLGNYILYILPSGKFEPVTNVQMSIRLALDPYKYTRRSQKLKKRWYSKLSSESYLRLEEESRDPDKLAVSLLNPAHLQKNYTVRGVLNFMQDLYLMRHNRRLSFRLRYNFSQNYNNQFLDANENDRRKSQEIGLRANWRPSFKLRSLTEGRLRSFYRRSTTNPFRDRDIVGYYVTQNVSYRPRSRLELGLGNESGLEKNSTATYPIELWFATLKPRLNYELPMRGRATIEYQLQNVSILKNPQNLVVPFEMARGRKAGISHTWQLRLEYTLSKNVLFTLQYTGRKDAGFERTIHAGQAQLRAFL